MIDSQTTSSATLKWVWNTAGPNSGCRAIANPLSESIWLPLLVRLGFVNSNVLLSSKYSSAFTTDKLPYSCLFLYVLYFAGFGLLVPNYNSQRINLYKCIYFVGSIKCRQKQKLLFGVKLVKRRQNTLEDHCLFPAINFLELTVVPLRRSRFWITWRGVWDRGSRWGPLLRGWHLPCKVNKEHEGLSEVAYYYLF